ncbi:hypothetical protein [Streptacidiphilus fuscans]|nr:hypothetical protein [Streptacidiphilus fuscans]
MVRDYVKIATEVATGVAGELRSKVPQPVRELADEVVGRALAESEKVWHRLSDGVVQAGVVLEFLEHQLRQFQGEATSTAEATAEADADGGLGADFGTTPEPAAENAPEDTVPNGREVHPPTGTTRPRPVRVPVDEPTAEDAAAAEAAKARRAAAVPGMRPRAAKQSGPEAESAAPAKKTAKRAPAKKTAAKKDATAKKAPAKQAAAKKTAAKKTAAKKTAASTAKKTAATKTTAAKKTPAKKATPRTAAPKRENPDD